MINWFTGLSKTTIAKKLKEILEKEYGKKSVILDGNEVREFLYPELGFSKEEREFHNKVVIYLSKYLSEKLGYYVIVSVIAPIRKVREFARNKIKKYLEVYLKADLEFLRQRKPEIYRDPTAAFYEEGNPDLILDAREELDKKVEKIIKELKERNWL
jgi:adenylylsulfate kinase